MRVDCPNPGQEQGLKELWQLAFGDSMEFIRGFFETGYERDCCRCVTLDGRMAAGLYWFDGEWEGGRLAYLYAVATHPDYRNRGLCRALMEDTHRVLKGRGYAGALLTPAKPELRRMYSGMGYEDCCRISEHFQRAGKPVALRKVVPEEYAALRRQLLPKGGVIQEGRNLKYLETYEELYAGEGFLVAGASDEGRFRAMELLGNPDAAPGILGALGYGEGTFRTPGEERPFAMFRPLAAGIKGPGYFGLAFD